MNDFYNGFRDHLRIFCGSYRCAWHWFAFHYFRNNTLRALTYEH